MNLNLENKTALITGASRGIGAASAKALAQHGARVIINYSQNRQKAQEVLDEIEKKGGEGMIVQADVRDNEAVKRMVDKSLKEFEKIDILINNANIDFPVKPFIELSWDEINIKVAGELRALYNCSQAVLPDMIRRKTGKLILISSGISRQPVYGFSAHAAAKAAVDGIARAMATELGPLGITVNVIGPGLILTDATRNQSKEMHEGIAASTCLKRIGQPDDIAGVVLFLASSLSDYLTGEYVPVNGGNFMI